MNNTLEHMFTATMPSTLDDSLKGTSLNVLLHGMLNTGCANAKQLLACLCDDIHTQ